MTELDRLVSRLRMRIWIARQNSEVTLRISPDELARVLDELRESSRKAPKVTVV